MAKSKKAKRERRKVSAKRRNETHKSSSFTATSFRLPEGRKLFQIKKPGSYRVDVIPFEAGKDNPFADEGELHFERTYYIHKNIGANEDSYVCERKTSNGRCPICEYRASLAKDPDADEKLVKELSPKERQLWNVIDHENVDEGIQLWEISYHLFGKKLDSMIDNADEDDDYDLFSDPIDGKVLKLNVEEQDGGGFSFTAVEGIEFKARKKPYKESIIDEAMCLDELIIHMDYDKLKAIFEQAPVSSDDDDDDDDDAPKKSKKSKKDKKTKKSKPSDDDDDDFTEDPVDEEMDEFIDKKIKGEKGKKKKKKKK